MKVLVGCEYSGVVRDAFRARGHDAFSCDILPTDSDPKYHIQGDVFDAIGTGIEWDLGIFHPPCTYLTNSGVCHLHKDKDRWLDMIDGALFFKKLLNCDIPRIAVENPIMHKYAKRIIEGTHTQVVQPWMFGHKEKKATCLWLKGLPPLVETDNVREETEKLPKNIQQRLHCLPPSEDRWKIRSTTYKGIAEAMAEQWGSLDTPARLT